MKNFNKNLMLCMALASIMPSTASATWFAKPWFSETPIQEACREGKEALAEAGIYALAEGLRDLLPESIKNRVNARAITIGLGAMTIVGTAAAGAAIAKSSRSASARIRTAAHNAGAAIQNGVGAMNRGVRKMFGAAAPTPATPTPTPAPAAQAAWSDQAKAGMVLVGLAALAGAAKFAARK